MLIKFEIQKKFEYWMISGLAALLSGVLAYVLGVTLPFCLLISLFLLAGLTVRVRLSDEFPVWGTAIIAAVMSFLIYTLTQNAVGTTIGSVSIIKTLVNCAVIFGLVSLLTVASGRLDCALIAVQIICVTLGVANHLVVQTRGMELRFSDLFSIGTAMSVAGGYTFEFSARTIGAIFFTLITVLFLVRNRLPRLRKLQIRIGGLVLSTTALVLSVLLITTTWGAALIGYKQLPWKIQSSTQNGFLASFINSISASRVSRPNGYSKDTLQTLLNQYRDQLDALYPPVTLPSKPPNVNRPIVPGQPEKEQDSPNVIVIMNETFSDLSAVASYLGVDMKTDTDLLPFFSSLSDDEANVAKGFAMSSVFGGNTANSEFEFLTGHSMAFMPWGTVAYSNPALKDNPYSIVDIFNKSGYLTVGLHPEPGSNWSRQQIYEAFGFDETYFLDSGDDSFVTDEKLTNEDYYRNHISDSTVYDRIIDLYEQKEEGTPLFTFAITMQNHGGYTSKDFDYTVKYEGDGSSDSVNEYLSTIQNSDAALQELISYFEAQEEETLIVFFGDHQPSLPTEFYSECFGITDESTTEQMQAKYMIPYLYWGNFDFESEFAELTSINYLSSHMLEIAGLPKTEYLKFTDLVEEEIIAINAYGWWDQDGVFHNFTEESRENVNLLLLYEYLQYNALFDQAKDKLLSWFILPETLSELQNEGLTEQAIGSKEEDAA